MSVASTNIYALLGNDAEDGSVSPVPVNTVTKTSTKTGKANADGTASAAPASGARGARGGFTKGETDYRGRGGNVSKPTDEVTRTAPRGGRGARGRGGRGATHHRNADDRHTKNIVPGSEKQAAQSWGATEGAAELNDEQAGEAIAQAEQKEAEAEDAEAEPQEPEVKQVLLDDYMAEQEAKHAELNSTISTREVDKEVPPEQKEYVRDDDEFFMGGSEVRSKGKKHNKRGKRGTEDAEELGIDFGWQPEAAAGNFAGRGGPRGRGGDRGDRRGAPRGGGPRGGPRGGAPRGGDGFSRGGARGGREAVSPTLKINDPEAFPSLGGN